MTDEIETLRKRVAELETSSLHTCHDQCPRLACVQGREIRFLQSEIMLLRQMLGVVADVAADAVNRCQRRFEPRKGKK